MLAATPIQASTSTTCSDPDGLDTTSKGVATRTTINKKTKKVLSVTKKTDTCISKGMLREYTCDKNGTIGSTIVSCPTGTVCQNGACSKKNLTTENTPTTTLDITITGVAPVGGAILSQPIMAGTQIGVFKITNNSAVGAILSKLVITDSGSHTGTSTTFRLSYSDQNNSNYTGNTAATNENSLNLNSLNSKNIILDGNSYRYFTVSIVNANGLVAGDTFGLSIKQKGDVQYQVNESDLGFDANLNGTLTDTITGLSVKGQPLLGYLQKI